MRSRFALAASVALLLLGSVLLPSRFAPNLTPEQGTAGPFSADRLEQWRMRKEINDKHLDNKPGLGMGEGDPMHDLDEFGLSPIK